LKSVVELEIDAPRPKVAQLFADPLDNPRWMEDIERVEPIRGEPGVPGSIYRLVPKRGKMVFEATVVSRKLPTELKLALDAPGVSVDVNGTLLESSAERTKLISEETFRFKGALRKLFGFLAQGAIRRAHRRHMESFKRFAESHGL
jgi:hypothetical protein